MSAPLRARLASGRPALSDASLRAAWAYCMPRWTLEVEEAEEAAVEGFVDEQVRAAEAELCRGGPFLVRR